MKFETDLPFCVRNVTTSQHVLFKFRYNIFIGVRIIKEMPGSVASGTFCISYCKIPDMLLRLQRIFLFSTLY